MQEEEISDEEGQNTKPAIARKTPKACAAAIDPNSTKTVSHISFASRIPTFLNSPLTGMCLQSMHRTEANRLG